MSCSIPSVVLDSNAKVTSGLLRGQNNHFGDFSMCTDIRSNVKRVVDEETSVVKVRGKYCLAHIEVQAAVPELRLPIHLLHGRGLFNSHLGNVSTLSPTRLWPPPFVILFILSAQSPCCSLWSRQRGRLCPSPLSR